jgi:hypothetical protein
VIVLYFSHSALSFIVATSTSFLNRSLMSLQSPKSHTYAIPEYISFESSLDISFAVASGTIAQFWRILACSRFLTSLSYCLVRGSEYTDHGHTEMMSMMMRSEAGVNERNLFLDII